MRASSLHEPLARRSFENIMVFSKWHLYISRATKTDRSIFIVVSNCIVVLKNYVVLALFDKPFFPYLLSLALLEELSSCQMQHYKKINCKHDLPAH